MKPEMQALLLMLNAIRLQLFAAHMKEPSMELAECLEHSAWMANRAMEIAELTEAPSHTDRKATAE